MFYKPSFDFVNKWEKEYYKQSEAIRSQEKNLRSLRYPDVFQNILLFSKRIDLMYGYQHRKCYERYMSPDWDDYSLAERKEKIESCRRAHDENYRFFQELIEQTQIDITNEFVNLYEGCMRRHFCITTYHDYSMLAFLK